MSIALKRTSSGGDRQIDRQLFDLPGAGCAPASIYNSAADRRFQPAQHLESEDQSPSLSSSSTSSIGKNSDDSSGGGGGGDEEEVQSEYKGGPLDSLDALEEVLPVKKSISKFYSGKSKSFTSLSDAASIPSIQDITKPENEYTRKRKNLLAFNTYLDKNRQIFRGGISKRPTNSRSMLVLAANGTNSETNSGDTSNSNSSPPGSSLPPLPPNARRPMNRELTVSPPETNFSPWRSFSLSDLQGAAVSETSSASGNDK